MLELALTLNPNYDFAHNQIKKYKNKKFYNSKKEEAIKHDPAVIYFNFLVSTGINLKTKEITTSQIQTHNS